MTADEIRNTNHGEISYLREIAAQLAEHNQHLGRIEFLLENIIDFNRGGIQVNVNRAN